ncbi:MAG: DUF3309 family protein [Sneathiella sp.]|nr:DUF3309 family protein [Sneathiella sp.]
MTIGTILLILLVIFLIGGVSGGFGGFGYGFGYEAFGLLGSLLIVVVVLMFQEKI